MSYKVIENKNDIIHESSCNTGNLPLKAQQAQFILHVFFSSRLGRSKQAATKENDSSEEVDVFQGSSPVNDDNPQEETEEEEVSTVNVCVYGSATCDRIRSVIYLVRSV